MKQETMPSIITKIQQMPDTWITPNVAAETLGSDPQTIRDQAHDDPALLGFPVCVVGRYTKIPRIPFLRFLGYESEPNHET